MPEFDDDKGVNAIMVNTPRVSELISALRIEFREVTFEQMLTGNSSYKNSVAYPVDGRKRFYSAYCKGKSFEFSVHKALVLPFYVRIINKLKCEVYRLDKNTDSKRLLLC